MSNQTVRVTIVSYEILNNDVYGGPRYAIEFDDGVTRTSQSGAAWCWGFGTNTGYRCGDTVDITVSRAGRVITMRPA